MPIPTPAPGEWVGQVWGQEGNSPGGHSRDPHPTLCPGTPAPLWRNSPLK